MLLSPNEIRKKITVIRIVISHFRVQRKEERKHEKKEQAKQLLSNEFLLENLTILFRCLYLHDKLMQLSSYSLNLVIDILLKQETIPTSSYVTTHGKW
jgi:hypothetical protein